jgi:hypothetical protein
MCVVSCILATIYITSLPVPHPSEIEITKVVVTEVEYQPSGSISVAQIDPIWHVKTSNGLTITSRHRFVLGDTIIIKKVKYGKLEQK